MRNNYNDKRFNFTRFKADYSLRRYRQPHIEFTGNYNFDVHGSEWTNDDAGKVCIRTPNYQNRIIQPNWQFSASQNIINYNNKTFGVLDDLFQPTATHDHYLSKYDDRWYLLFAMLNVEENTILNDGKAGDPKEQFVGYGLWNAPFSKGTIDVEINKGDTGNFIAANTSYYTVNQFTTGADVLICTFGDEPFWNVAKILKINTDNTIYIKTYNNSYWGNNLEGPEELEYSMIQLNRFRPYNISGIDKNKYENYHLITCGIKSYFDRGYYILARFDYNGTHTSIEDSVWLSNQSINTLGSDYPLYEQFPPTATKGYIRAKNSLEVSGRYAYITSIESNSTNVVINGESVISSISGHIDIHPLICNIKSYTGNMSVSTWVTGFDEVIL